VWCCHQRGEQSGAHSPHHGSLPCQVLQAFLAMYFQPTSPGTSSQTKLPELITSVYKPLLTCDLAKAFLRIYAQSIFNAEKNINSYELWFIRLNFAYIHIFQNQIFQAQGFLRVLISPRLKSLKSA